MQPILLQVDVVTSVETVVGDVVAFLPQFVGALAILIVGWFLGRVAYRLVRATADRLDVDRRMLRTPIGAMAGGTEQAVANTFGTLAAWFVYALAILAAADVLAIELLSEWIATAVSYFPALLAGGLVIVIGFILADFVGDVVARMETITETGYTDAFADGIRVLLYFVAVVIALDTVGVSTDIIFLFAQAVAFGLAAGLALAIGIGFGWGSKDYVAENIGSWFGRAPRPVGTGQTDGGTEQADGGASGAPSDDE